jgi:hypothetical protein
MTRKSDDEIRDQINALQLELDKGLGDFEGNGKRLTKIQALKWTLGEIEGTLHYDWLKEGE